MAGTNPIVSYLRDLFGSPDLAVTVNRGSRSALTGEAHGAVGSDVKTNRSSRRGEAVVSKHGAVDSDVKVRLKQYESRLHDLHKLASKQAADISELRSAAEGLQKRQSKSSPAGPSTAMATPVQAPPQMAMVTPAPLTPPMTASTPPQPPAHQEELLQKLLSEAIGQQKSALAASHGEVLDVLRVLREQQAVFAERQAAEWRHVLREATEAHRREQEELRTQLGVLQKRLEATQRASLSPAPREHPAAAAAAKSPRGATTPGACPTNAVAAAELARGARRAVRELRLELGELREQTVHSLVGGQADMEQFGLHLRLAVRGAQEQHRSLRAARREAVNRLQESQGAIRVLCRCRPLSKGERAAGELMAVRMASYDTIGFTQGVGGDASSRESVGGAALGSEFSFDSVLGAEATQRDLFEEVSPAISSVLRGQYVCVMAYGQTGSGKTYTMYGSAATPGLVRQSVAQLLEEAAAEVAERKERGSPASVEMAASLLEVYNDKVRDLLSEDNAEPVGFGGLAHEESRSSLEVRVAADGSVTVPGLVRAPFSDVATIARLIDAGSARRVTHGTKCNAASSRSHLVLTIHCVLTSHSDGSALHGRCHLVDLAGSERIAQSGVEGDRLREAQHINKSLSALEQVFVALQARGKDVAREAHVPYRNSKLTMLLSDALGAKGACAKTLMVMQVSPAASSANESLRTLRFGERCQSVTLGAVRRGNKKADRPGSEDERARTLQLELTEARRRCKEAETRAKSAESRAASLAASIAAGAGPLLAASGFAGSPAASTLAAALAGATLAQAAGGASRGLSALRRQQLGLRAARELRLDGSDDDSENSPANAVRPTASQHAHKLRPQTARGAEPPPAHAPRASTHRAGAAPLYVRPAPAPALTDRVSARRSVAISREAAGARERALLYEAASARATGRWR